MADITIPELQALLSPYEGVANAIEMYAQRPQKTSVSTVTTSTPTALADMLARRDEIGKRAAALDDVLKEREGFGYNMANALSGIPQQTGYGTWLGDFARAFGAGYSGATNARVDRAIKRYNNDVKDLETALKFDKEMGSTQTQEQSMGYTEMPFGGGSNKNKTQNQGTTPKDIASTEIAATTLGDLYKTIDANPQTFSATGGIKQDATSMGLKSGVETTGVDTIGKREFQYLQSIMPQGFATTINTAKEQEIMRPYTTKFKTGRGSEKKATIKSMLGSMYDAYALDAAAQGFQMPISKEDYIKSRIDAGREINAEWYSNPDKPMYKESQPVQKQRTNDEIMKDYLEGLI